MIDSIQNVHVIDKIVEVTLLYLRHLLTKNHLWGSFVAIYSFYYVIMSNIYYTSKQAPQISFVRFAALDEFVHQVLSSRFCGEKPGGNPMF